MIDASYMGAATTLADTEIWVLFLALFSPLVILGVVAMIKGYSLLIKVRRPKNRRRR
jgi:hypothetical protein